jgi:hypothetical protein
MIKKGNLNSRKTAENQGESRFSGQIRPFYRQKNPAGGFFTAREGGMGGLGRENDRFYSLQAA